MSEPIRSGRIPQTGMDVAKRTVATFSDYEQAQMAVDRLSDAKFPVERVEIVGSGLRYVEKVTGRFDYGKAALTGAINGAILGALIGWIFGLFNWARPLVTGLVLAGWGALVGAIIGAILGLIAHSVTGGRRDFASVSGTAADRYELRVDADLADEAAGILGTGPARSDGALPRSHLRRTGTGGPNAIPADRGPGDGPIPPGSTGRTPGPGG
jgi:hypothetical protein